MFASHNGILLIEPFVLQAVRDNFCTAAWRNLAHGTVTVLRAGLLLLGQLVKAVESRRQQLIDCVVCAESCGFGEQLGARRIWLRGGGPP